jgi:hypothetical protein
MQRRTFWIRRWQFAIVVIAILYSGLPDAIAGGKLGIYGIRMEPSGEDAADFSAPSWGLGLHAVVPVPRLWNVLAGVAGVEIINFLRESTEFQDQVTGLRVEQDTNQNYFRVYIGSQLGGHGNGFLRPHIGLNLALVNYYISTDVVVPDDYDREKEIRQNLSKEGHWVFGYDVTLGVDLNFSNTIALDGGVRYVKSFSVPQQLGEGSETIHPQYFQIYLGIGVSFQMLSKIKSEEANADNR